MAGLAPAILVKAAGRSTAADRLDKRVAGEGS
jgi:hypothetical protein